MVNNNMLIYEYNTKKVILINTNTTVNISKRKIIIDNPTWDNTEDAIQNRVTSTTAATRETRKVPEDVNRLTVSTILV